jgi:hypothetical protein
VCFPWQQWTESSLWFDDVGISEFHSRAVVDIWQSLSEWRLYCLSVFCFAVANNSWILHHDNAPAFFFLFPNIKEIFKGRHSDDTDDIRSNTTAGLKAIPQNSSNTVLKGGIGAGIG